MLMMVKPTSREPRNAAWKGGTPFSTWRMMFSSITIASSTTRPTAKRQAQQRNVVQAVGQAPQQRHRTDQ
jgi:hypothetical protein